MEFERFFKFSQLLLRDKFILSLSGYVSEDFLEAVGDTLRRWWQRDKMQKRDISSQSPFQTGAF